ncbi:MAG: ABC transporter ATP-binding protein [Planctomycetes bacterium]|nr:ABC transporter ATP-binding protein [Planctomycetota bacterium]
MYDIVLECRNLSHWFGNQKVLYDINLKVVRGEIVALVGPSGCGKSTLLRAILGTHPPCSGQVLMNGQPITGPSRERGMIYQRYSLFPYLTAQGNVAFGLMLDQAALHLRLFQFWKWRKLRKTHFEQAAELLDQHGLDKALHLYPSEMSGGMNQRVAIAQALIMKPEILLLDEPFGALDEATREEHQGMLLGLYQENLDAKKAGRKPPYTMIIVTHELNEAIYVSDRVVALSQHWLWEEQHSQHPGATIVYDATAPVFPRDRVDKSRDFFQQRTEIRQVAFDPSGRHKRGTFVRFWRECQEGKGVGVMQP